jgi:hypothetical protein
MVPVLSGLPQSALQMNFYGQPRNWIMRGSNIITKFKENGVANMMQATP